MAQRKNVRNNVRRKNSAPNRTNTGAAIVRFPSPRVHELLRSSSPGLLVSGPVDTSYRYTPSLSDFSNSADISGSWEMYRIKRLRFMLTCSTFNTASDLPFPRVVLLPDYNDSAAVTLSSATGYEEAIEHTFTPTNPTLTVEIEPKVANAIYRNGVVLGYNALSSPWIDSSYNDVPHYGIKLFIQDYNSTTTPTRRIYLQYQAVIEVKHAS